MKVRMSLQIEGSSELLVLCYGVFPLQCLESAEGVLKNIDTTFKVFKLIDVDWPVGVLLTEVRVASGEMKLEQVCLDAMNRMLSTPRCMAALCMYDGAFFGHASILSADIASQTYAFCFAAGMPVIAFDDSLLDSVEWQSIILCSRKKLDLMIQSQTLSLSRPNVQSTIPDPSE